MPVLPRGRRAASRADGGRLRRSSSGASDGSAAIARIAEEAGRLGVEIVDIAGNVESVADSATAQADAFVRMRDVTAAMRRSSTNVVETADGVREHAAAAEATVRVSAGDVSASLASLDGLAGWVGDVGGQLGAVVERLDSIGEVTQRMSRIATQTHILALNARIEATRAGRGGAGFAVIADSVRALADESKAAAGQIDATVAGLTGPLTELRQQTETAGERAREARGGVDALSDLVTQVSASVGSIGSDAAAIARIAGDNKGRADDFATVLDALIDDVRRSSDQLEEARTRVNRLLASAEQVLGLTAASGAVTVDSRFIESAIDAAGRIAALFEDALSSGRVSEADLFDEAYRELPNTNPQQYLTRFTALTDELLPPIQEGMLELDERVVFSAAVDRNGYLPTHNVKFSKPQGDDPAWNTANCRNRRLFNDRTGLAAGRNTEPYLLQTYRRDMGGGSFALMKDVSAPIYVRGRHWGGLRIGYRV